MLHSAIILSLFLQSIASLHLKDPYTDDIESLLKSFSNNPVAEFESFPDDSEIPVDKQNELNVLKAQESEKPNEELDSTPATNNRKAHARQPYKIPLYLQNQFYEQKPKKKYQKDKQLDAFHVLPALYPTEIPLDLASDEDSTDIPVDEAITQPTTKSFLDLAFTEKPLKNDQNPFYDLTVFTEKPQPNNPLSFPELDVANKPSDMPLTSNDPQNLVLTESQRENDSEKEKLMKAKLISLILSTKADFEKVINDVDAMHKSYKSGTMYKIGYLAGLLKKMNIRLSKLFPRLLSKYDEWDNLKILSTFERVKSSSDLAQGMLKMMKHLIEIEQMYKPKYKLAHAQDLERAINPGTAISWSYYDESMS